jgi:hypothetical protein
MTLVEGQCSLSATPLRLQILHDGEDMLYNSMK